MAGYFREGQTNIVEILGGCLISMKLKMFSADCHHKVIIFSGGRQNFLGRKRGGIPL